MLLTRGEPLHSVSRGQRPNGSAAGAGATQRAGLRAILLHKRSPLFDPSSSSGSCLLQETDTTPVRLCV